MKAQRFPLAAAILLGTIAFLPSVMALDGQRDPAFRPAFRQSTTVSFATDNADGTILLDGGFDHVRGEPRRPVALLRADGSLEPSFTPDVDRGANAAVRQSDGRVVCLEAFPSPGRLYRLAANGALDPSFVGPTGAAVIPGATILQLAADDHLLIARQTAVGEVVVRVLPNGSEDPSFLAGTGTANFGELAGVQGRADGSTWVWGSFSSYRGIAASRVTRLRRDGTVDPAFRSAFPDGLTATSLAPAADGGALVIGYDPSSTDQTRASQTLVRLTATGAVASSLPAANPVGGGAISWVERSGGTRVVRRLSGVSVVPTVQVDDLRADGSIERTTSYSAAGNPELDVLAVSADGAPLFAERRGNFFAAVLPPGQERLLWLVPGAAGPLLLGIDVGDVAGATIAGLAAASDGRVFTWGNFRSVNGIATPVSAAVLRPDGVWDPMPAAGLEGWSGFLYAAIPLPTGGWALGGYFYDQSDATPITLLRLDASGRVDQAWLAAERARPTANFRALAADPQGRVLVLARLGSFGDARLLRLLADGTTDPSFQAALSTDTAAANALSVLPDGRIYVGFHFDPRLFADLSGGTLVRLLPDGRLDAAFNRANAYAYVGFAPRPDGSVVVVQKPVQQFELPEGQPAYSLRAARLFADGTIDTSFSARGRFDDTLVGVTRLRDDRLLLDGVFLSFGERSRFGLARLAANGELDASFRPELPVASGQSYTGLSQRTGVKALVELPDGSLLAAPRAGSDPLVRLLVAPLPAVPGRGRGQLTNVSSRGRVEAGDRAMIAGFVVTGGPKRVIVRALGPSLAGAGVPGPLANPTLEISAGGTSLATNDDWAAGSAAADITAAGLSPSDARESAVALTLPPGAYTALVRGVGGAAGVALVEVYVRDAPDYASPPPAAGAPRAANLSTRAFVGAGDNVLIGGFTLRGGSARVALRGLGPTLAGAGVPGTLADPYLSVVRQIDGATVFASDSWRQQAAGLGDTRPLVLPTPTDAEIGTVLDLPEGDYTVLVSGANGATGIGLFEVYELPDNGAP